MLRTTGVSGLSQFLSCKGSKGAWLNHVSNSYEGDKSEVEILNRAQSRDSEGQRKHYPSRGEHLYTSLSVRNGREQYVSLFIKKHIFVNNWFRVLLNTLPASLMELNEASAALVQLECQTVVSHALEEGGCGRSWRLLQLTFWNIVGP